MHIHYVPLEPYEDRYTLQLRDWNEREFKRLGVSYSVIEGELLTNDKRIKTGVVLDVHGRSYYALSQIMKIVKLLQDRSLTRNDFIFFEDMFHPGIEALGYILNQQYAKGYAMHRPGIGMRCLAQSIDPDDFIHYNDLAGWMRHYEQMVCKFVDVLFVASEEMLPFMGAANWDVPVIVTGLPFGKQEVRNRIGMLKPFEHRKHRVVFASRLAPEKQPEFFVEVARRVKAEVAAMNLSVEFAIVSGGKISYSGIDKAVIDGILSVYPYQSKDEYYALLNDSKVLFNCALQDWVSNTLSEADTLGCNVVFPAYRSFPEALANSRSNLYIPWDVNDAVDRVFNALMKPLKTQGMFSDYQNGSIERTVLGMSSMCGNGLAEVTNPSYPYLYRNRIVKKALGEL